MLRLSNKERAEMEEKILAYLLDGKSDEEIMELIPRCVEKRIRDVRLRNNLLKIRRVERVYTTISDLKYEEKKESKAVPIVIDGKKCWDITGDVVDCGSAYGRVNG